MSYETSITKVEVVKQLNELSKFSLTLPKTQQNLENFAAGKEVTIELCDQEVLKGIVTEVNVKHDYIQVSGYELAFKLSRKIFEKDQGQPVKQRVEYINTAANTILQDILSCYGSEFTLAEAPTDLITVRFEFVDCLDAIKHVAEVVGKDWWFDESKALHVADRGTYRRELPVSQYEKIESRSDLINKVTVLGYGDGINQISVTVQDDESIASYGLHEAAFVNKKIHDLTTLSKVADLILEQYKEPRETIVAKTDVLEALDLEPGDSVTVEGKTLRIYKLTFNETEATLELGSKVKRLTEKQKELVKGLQSVEQFAQGATNLYCVQDSDNCDSTHPMRLRFYIPDEAVAINRVKLNVKREYFRAYSKAAKSKDLGTKTSTVVTPSHTHDVNIGTKTSETVLPSHTHDVEIGTKTSEAVLPSHTHDVEIGGTTSSSTTPPYNWGSCEVEDDWYLSCPVPYQENAYQLVIHLHIYKDAEKEVRIVVDLLTDGGYSVWHNNYKFTEYGNVLTTKFVVPGNYNGYNCKVKVYDLYSYSTVTCDSISVNMRNYGGHTHTVDFGTKTSESGGGSHSHDVNIGTVTSASGGGSHSHDVNIGTVTSAAGGGAHSHDVYLGSHSHGLDYGIYEYSTLYNVDIKVNGTSLGSYGDVNDLDITEYCNKGWNEVVITPGGLLRVVASVFVQVFIQSK